MSMDELARHIIAVAHTNNQHVTNLKLQKAMYYAMQFLMNGDKEQQQLARDNYDQPFLVWKYGPTIKDIHEKYRIYGSTSITENTLPVEKFSIVDNVIMSKLNKSGYQLIIESIDEPFWQAHRQDIAKWRSSTEYTLEDIKGK